MKGWDGGGGDGGACGGNRGHPRLTVAVIIIAAVQRALREAPLRRYRQRLPYNRGFGVIAAGCGPPGAAAPTEVRQTDAV